ncbi:MAG: hypothetical protein RI894_772 [Bacteroidota bacterium]
MAIDASSKPCCFSVEKAVEISMTLLINTSFVSELVITKRFADPFELAKNRTPFAEACFTNVVAFADAVLSVAKAAESEV